MRDHCSDHAVLVRIRVNESADRCHELPRIAGIELTGYSRLANHRYRLLCYRLRFMKILSTCYHDEFPIWILPDWAVERLQQQFPDFEVVKLTSRHRLVEEIENTDILLAW